MILIVEDDAETRNAVARLLRTVKYQTRLAASAAEAMAALEREPVRLVLLDLGLPDRDGIDVLRQIRLSPAFCRTPVVVYSASSDRRAQAKAAGANAFVVKTGPAFGELLAAIESIAGPPEAIRRSDSLGLVTLPLQL